MKVAIIATTLCALAMTALVARRELSTPPDPRTLTVAAETIRTLVSDSAAMIVAQGGPNTLVVFSDYECPYCQRLSGTLDSLARTGRTAVGVRYRHYPLTSIHRSAQLTALAVICAREQGTGVRMHSWLFAEPNRASSVTKHELLLASGTKDTVAFAQCIESPRALQRLGEDVALGNSLGVDATPTLYWNGRRLSRPPTLEELDSLVCR